MIVTTASFMAPAVASPPVTVKILVAAAEVATWPFTVRMADRIPASVEPVERQEHEEEAMSSF